MTQTELRPDTDPARPSRFSRAVNSDLFHSFRGNPVAVVSAIVVLVLILSAVFAPLIAPHDPFNPATLNLMNGFSACGHWRGRRRPHRSRWAGEGFPGPCGGIPAIRP